MRSECEVVEAGHPASAVWETDRTWVWKEMEDGSRTIANIARS